MTTIIGTTAQDPGATTRARATAAEHIQGSRTTRRVGANRKCTPACTDDEGHTKARRKKGLKEIIEQRAQRAQWRTTWCKLVLPDDFVGDSRTRRRSPAWWRKQTFESRGARCGTLPLSASHGGSTAPGNGTRPTSVVPINGDRLDQAAQTHYFVDGSPQRQQQLRARRRPAALVAAEVAGSTCARTMYGGAT